MTETQKLELFFSQTTELCHRYSKGQFPSKTRDTLHAWSDASLKAAQQEEFLEILAKGLAALRDQLPLGNLMQLELAGVLAIQSDAIEIPGWPNNGETDTPTPNKFPSARLPARAIRASKSLLGSWREILKGLVPDWVLGILKVFEEMTEIYGPAN